MNSQLDEQRLTAYALGELADDDAARQEIEQRLERDPALRDEVEQIRAVAQQLREQLAAEPVPEAAPVVLPVTTQPTPVTPPAPSRPSLAPSRKLDRRPRWGARLAMAAAVAVVVGGAAFTVLGILEPARMQRSRLASDVGRVEQSTARNARVNSGAAADGAQASTPQSGATADNKKVAPEALPYSFQSPPQASGSEANATPPLTPVAGPAPAITPAATEAPAAAPSTPAPPVVTATPSVDAVTATPSLDAGQSAPYGLPAQQVAPAAQPRREALALRTSSASATNGPTFNLQQQQQGQQQGGGGGGQGLFGIGAGDREFNTEAYDRVVDNPFLDVIQNPLSTFSVDVDTASYSNVRRFLMQGQKPPKDAVRIEELVNYFPYDYAPPAKDSKEPFATHVEVADCPWRPEHRLVRVGIKGKEIAADKRPASNLVFLLDVSGSMQPQNKLPLVKRAMRMLLEQLNGEDRVAIVVYAGSSGLALPSTACTDGAKRQILTAIETLSAGGSTNGEQGIQLAYTIAQQHFIEGGTNRVVLCTDGDFNVGVTNQGDLTRTIEEKAKSGVFLSVLGFGMGNLKDSTMEKLADKGNGNYAYIDTLQEAKKVLVEQMSGTLVTIAKDVKIQIEFNPAVVGSYRLIGYENRLLAKEDFNDDKKDAGEIGAGHAVTALYEVVPAGKKAPGTPPKVDELKYQKPATAAAEAAADGEHAGEMLTLKLRYKQPDGETSALIETPVTDEGQTFAKSSRDFKFASAVAAFGMILRDSPHRGRATYPAVLEWAEDGLGEDRSGYRNEFLELVKRAKATEGN